MKRSGFTMIELIFVIVILGILAAVALPKFIGVSDQANAAKCDAFVGTLNRTVGPSMWSESITEGTSGHVPDSAGADIIVNDHIALEDIPTECYNVDGGSAPAQPTTDAAAETIIFAANTTAVFGNSTYDINFTDGNLSESPRWTWTKRP
jgi:prepilin-type N-terminal cleavage/methylation domain-containing protein